MLNQMSPRFVGNYLKNVVRARVHDAVPMDPLVFTYFVTNRCNLSCSFCNAANTAEARDPEELDTSEAMALIRIVRQASRNLYLSGGEPMLRTDLVPLLAYARRLGFNSLSMVTNMSLMHRNLAVLDHLSNLVVSLNMLDREAYAEVVGSSATTVSQIIGNIILCAGLQREKGFRMFVNFVINPTTIPHAPSIIRFCEEHGLRLSLSPQTNPDGSMIEALIGYRPYTDLVQDIIDRKATSRLVLDSRRYLATIKDQLPFTCYPTLTPRINAKGEMHYPCTRKGGPKIDLLRAGSYEAAIAQGKQLYGPVPRNCHTCYMNTYIEPANYVTHPLSTLQDYLH